MTAISPDDDQPTPDDLREWEAQEAQDALHEQGMYDEPEKP